MNKKLAVIALLAGSAFVSAAQAADGVVNFTGNIMDVACTINPTSASQNVALGSVVKGAFTGTGSAVAPTRFSITLTKCPAAATAASIKFDGPTNPDNSSLLALTSGSGVATGVGIGIYESDSNTPIAIGTASAKKTLPTDSSDATFNFVAKYVATKAPVTVGTANAVSNFTVSYN